ncbi:MAG: HAD-IA family hydrolase [Pseudomonadota bacterium]
MAMRGLKLAVWDMDGTIVDSREVIQGAMARAFEALDLAPPPYDATRQIVGLSLDEACRRLTPEGFDPRELPRLVEAYKDAFIAQRAAPDFEEPLYAGALEALQGLAEAGWLIAMATGKSHRGIRAVFERHPMEPLFDTIWCADDGPGKPHPFMVEQAMKAVGAAAAGTVVIGDAVHDMQMSRAAGASAFGVSWGFGAPHELDAAGAHEVHHDFDTLNAALARFGEDVAGG